MHILQISNDFAGSKVHANLYQALAKNDVRQNIYCPVRNASLIGHNNIETDGIKVIYDFVIKPHHKYVYHIKRRTIFKSLQEKMSLNDVDLCHAATLFSDGGQAYKLNKKYNIPYIVTVRITDYSFLTKAPHAWLAAKKILLKASKIVFVSPALKEKFCAHFVIKTFLPQIEGKIVLAKNGIDDYWINNVNRNDVPDNHSVLYVGTMIRRKHPLLLIDAILKLKDKYPDIKLNLIGSTGIDEAAVIEKANSNPGVIIYHGRINDKQVMLEKYRNNSVFILPSTHETFGLVYFEALSQNLPVVYTKGEGVDGFLEECNGERIITPSVENIKVAIEKIFINRDIFSNSNIDFESFRWSNIANEYYKLYSEIIASKQ